LQHKGVGEIVAVATRYFDGVKLGADGLVRAYGGVVQQALDALPVVEQIAYRQARLVLPYALENPVRHLLESMKLFVYQSEYENHVMLYIRVPEAICNPLAVRLYTATAGTAVLHWIEKPS